MTNLDAYTLGMLTAARRHGLSKIAFNTPKVVKVVKVRPPATGSQSIRGSGKLSTGVPAIGDSSVNGAPTAAVDVTTKSVGGGGQTLHSISNTTVEAAGSRVPKTGSDELLHPYVKVAFPGMGQLATAGAKLMTRAPAAIKGLGANGMSMIGGKRGAAKIVGGTAVVGTAGAIGAAS